MTPSASLSQWTIYTEIMGWLKPARAFSNTSKLSWPPFGLKTPGKLGWFTSVKVTGNFVKLQTRYALKIKPKSI